MSYQTIKLGQIVEVKGGKRLPKGEKLLEIETNHPYIRARDIRGGSVSFDEPVYISERIHKKIKRYTVRTDNICITIVGANVGDVGMVPAWLDGANLTENAVKLTDYRLDCDPAFLKYALLSDGPQKQMKLFAAGAAQPKLGLYKVREVNVPFPSFSVQRKIATILSAYDDLIENNTRRIAILEEMAQLIYREWFVHFRFPGHEDVAMVETELGPVPEGWEVRKLKSIARVNRESIRKGDGPDIIHYINISSVSPGRIDGTETMPLAEAPSRARRVVRHGDTIWSTVRPNRRSYALIVDPVPDTIASTGFAVLTPKSVPYTFLYYAVTTDEFAAYLANRATGSAYPAVNTKDFKGAKVIVPDANLLASFHDIVVNMVAVKETLLNQNSTLRRTRDLLLPRLVSGELDVSDLDIAGV